MPFSESLIGQQIANYRVERLLGRGGMASVYFGVDLHLQRPAAIKIIDERFRDDAAYSERFLREARAMASWRHPNIPQIYQAGVEEGIYFYAMEYIHGMDLSKLLSQYAAQGEILTYEDVLLIGRAIAEALDYAHQKGAIHRDVKPSNVMIAEDDRILLMDFGLILVIEKGTRGEVFGSPQYISPEQANNSASVVPQSDLYSLGVMLYEMFVGVLPFEDPSPAVIALKHITQEPPPPREKNPDLVPEVEAVLLRALKKDPKDRYASGKELMDALERALQSQKSKEKNSQVGLTLKTIPELEDSGQDRGVLVVSQLRLADLVARDLPPHLETLPSLLSSASSQPSTLTSLSSGTYPLTADSISVEPASPPRSKYRRPVIGLSAFVILALLCSSLSLGIVLASRFGKNGKAEQTRSALSGVGLSTPESSPVTKMPTSTGNVGIGVLFTATPTKTAIQPSRTPLPTATPRPFTSTSTVRTQPTATQSPSFHLQLVAQRDESLHVINQGSRDLPLSFFVIGKEDKSISGLEWGIEALKPGQCLQATKDEGKVKLPKDIKCEVVGNQVTRSGSGKIWDSDYEVFFKDVRIGRCKKNTTCELRFQSP